MTAKVYNHNRFHNSDSEPVAAEGYVDQYGTFVPDNIDDLLPVWAPATMRTACADRGAVFWPSCPMVRSLP